MVALQYRSAGTFLCCTVKSMLPLVPQQHQNGVTTSSGAGRASCAAAGGALPAPRSSRVGSAGTFLCCTADKGFLAVAGAACPRARALRDDADKRIGRSVEDVATMQALSAVILPP